ncbi:hypothetical protein KIPB_016025, partial [Kipferlia bialata]|eukprot:g16025.t1
MGEAKALLETLTSLAPRQAKALSLVRELERLPKVQETEVEDAEYEVSDVEHKLKRPRMSAEQRQKLTRELSGWRERLNTLRRAKAERERLTEQLQGHCVFPE